MARTFCLLFLVLSMNAGKVQAQNQVTPQQSQLQTQPQKQDQEPEDDFFPLPNANNPKSLQDNITALVAGNNTFAVALYTKFKNISGNLLFSPYAISAAMALPYAGSKGPTQTQIQAGMHYIPQEQALLESMSWLSKQLTTNWYLGPNESRYLLANSLWCQKVPRVNPDYLTMISTYFKGSFREVDFQNNIPSALLNINEWTREKTQAKVATIIQPEMIDKTTSMALTSAAGLKAVWEFPFNPAVTVHDAFFVSPTTTLSIPMMTVSQDFPYFEHDLFAMVELPFRAGFPVTNKLSLVILLPKQLTGLPQVEAVAFSDRINLLLQNMQTERVIVSLPRFKLMSTFTLINDLASLGIQYSFSTLADFSGISSKKDLLLSQVIHKAYLSLDEKGSEAIAATPFTINSSLNEEVSARIFKVNRPFLFLIREKTTGAVLFMGRISVPSD